MSYTITVSPDFSPDHISGWYIFNTWLQKALDEPIHLQLFDDFNSQRRAIADDNIDLIYANPYDAAMLVREKGFLPVCRAGGSADEAIIAVNDENPAQGVEDLPAGITVATTDDPDVHLIGMIMLEPADLSADNVTLQTRDSYVLVAKDLLRGQADVGIFLAEAFENLSGMVRKSLRPLVSSEIQVIHHSFMVGPKLAERRDEIRATLLGMNDDAKGQGVLESMGWTRWEAVDDEEAEFMIDLMDTLGS